MYKHTDRVEVGDYFQRNGRELDYFDELLPRPNQHGYSTPWIVARVTDLYIDLVHPTFGVVTVGSCELERCFQLFEGEPLASRTDIKVGRGKPISPREADIAWAQEQLHNGDHIHGVRLEVEPNAVVLRTGAPMISFHNAQAPFDTKLTVVSADESLVTLLDPDPRQRYPIPTEWVTNVYFRVLSSAA